MGGYNDGTFRPANPLSKNHFCAMLARAFFPETIATYDTAQYRAYGSFAPTSYALAHNGVLDGSSFQWYFTDSSVMTGAINRYDMAQLLANILKAKGVSVSDAEKSAAASQIADYSSIPGNYQTAVASSAAKGLIGGYSDGNFYGSRSMNRGQAAVVIYRLQNLVPGQSETPPAQQEAPAQTPDPAPAPSQTPASAGRTLANGEPITEENVTAILKQLEAKYPNKTSFGGGYASLSSSRNANNNCISQVTKQYIRAANQHGSSTILSTTAGCGGWAAFVCDEVFGQTNVTWRQTTLSSIRPGDLMIKIDDGGHLTHVQVYVEPVSGYTSDQIVRVASASGATASSYKISWPECVTLDVNYDVYTAYPD